MRLADLSSKIEAFKKIHERYDNTPIGDLALLKLANVYYKNMAYQKAMETLEKIVLKPIKDEGGKAARSLFMRSCERAFQEYYKSHEVEKLINLYEKYQELLYENLSPSAQLMLANAYTEVNQPDKAIGAFESINRNDLSQNEVSQYVVGLARAYDEAGEPLRAIKFLESNISRIKKKDVRTQISLFLAELYRKELHLDKALKIYEELTRNGLVNDKKELAKVYLYMGEIYNKRQKHEAAMTVLDKSISILEKEKVNQEMKVAALIELSKSYRYMGNASKAVAITEQILGSGYDPGRPKYWELKFFLAETYLSLGKISKAETIYREISDEGPASLQQRAQMRLGSINLDRQLSRLSDWSNSRRRNKSNVASR